MGEIECSGWSGECRWMNGRCVVSCLRGMNLSWVVVGKSMSALGDRRVLWKLSDSCDQHSLHQVDTYV
jgi:hypothetical protein